MHGIGLGPDVGHVFNATDPGCPAEVKVATELEVPLVHHLKCWNSMGREYHTLAPMGELGEPG